MLGFQSTWKNKVYVQATRRSLQKVYRITVTDDRAKYTLTALVHAKKSIFFSTTLSNTTTCLIMVHKKLSLGVWLQCL